MHNEKQEVLNRIRSSYITMDVPGRYISYIEEAIESKEWDWFMNCDGCTAVAEHWADRYFPPCLVHDYFRQTKSKKPLEADLIFKDLIEIYTFSRFKSFWFFIGVRLTWLIFRR